MSWSFKKGREQFTLEYAAHALRDFHIYFKDPWIVGQHQLIVERIELYDIKCWHITWPDDAVYIFDFGTNVSIDFEHKTCFLGYNDEQFSDGLRYDSINDLPDYERTTIKYGYRRAKQYVNRYQDYVYGAETLFAKNMQRLNQLCDITLIFFAKNID